MNKNRLIAPLLGALALLGGAGAGIASLAAAQTATTDTTATAQTVTPDTTSRPAFDPSKGGHIGQNGVEEELLTGTLAEQVKAAALVAVPGGTVQRVETDAEGAAYEAHMTKADGSHVTVKFDSSFKVTATEDGPNGPHMQTTTQ